MNEPQDRPEDEPRRDETIVLLADRLLREPEIVAWLGAGGDDDEPWAA